MYNIKPTAVIRFCSITQTASGKNCIIYKLGKMKVVGVFSLLVSFIMVIATTGIFNLSLAKRLISCEVIINRYDLLHLKKIKTINTCLCLIFKFFMITH